MLELKNITKDYTAGDTHVEALKGVSLQFRECEFVSILGPSGCGKTTMLNIIGGLDQYTSGDLIIGGKSTKHFKNRDWDTYRNHTIGFVFQSYNLISHQSVLSNVELAMTLSGVSRTERRRRAIEALEKVGLADQLSKKPNQMSGGQMQRVAIARALVNNPDILLADEPTGALDSATSEQIMKLLKEVAKDRLVIMVTHNPDLADRYSTRIIRLLDGKVVDDSNPYSTGQEMTAASGAKLKKSSMSFLTALSLSFNNLLTKKGRTLMVSFAGSIGIIGIALILSLSNGATEYIYQVEEDTLSSYPLSIQSASMDTSSMLTSIMAMQNKDPDNLGHDTDAVYSNNLMNKMMELVASEIKTNDLEAFKTYIESSSELASYTSEIQYLYSTQMNIYSSDTTDGIVQVEPSNVFAFMGELRGQDSSEDKDSDSSSNPMASMSSMSMMGTSVWTELSGNPSTLESQYEVIAGRLPEAYNELILMVDENNEITDYVLYALGLMDADELSDMMKRIMAQEEVDAATEASRYTYDELLDLTFRLMLNTDYYEKENGMWIDRSNDEDFMKKALNSAETLKVVGIVRPSADSVVSNSIEGIGYTKQLMPHLIEQINSSEIVKEQTANPDINVFTGLAFGDTASQQFSIENLTDEQKAQMAQMSEEELTRMQAAMMTQYAAEASDTYESNLLKLGVSDLDVPSSILIYPKDFESKDKIVDIINQYNSDAEAAGNDNLIIRYSDVVGTMMSSVTTIINAITYILIAFVAISLVVSSIMIGIITYISVLERTKEIGILRAIGASKKDISRVFNAETLIIGFCAGFLGIAITLLLCLPINAVVKNAFDINQIAVLPTAGAVALVIISMALTLIAGVIPSHSASRKDPVTALRTE